MKTEESSLLNPNGSLQLFQEEVPSPVILFLSPNIDHPVTDVDQRDSGYQIMVTVTVVVARREDSGSRAGPRRFLDSLRPRRA
jgi:hypothetical protein